MKESASKMNRERWIDTSIIILFFVGLLLFLFFIGTLNSGYHFTDDHEMIEIQTDLAQNSFVDSTIKWMHRDLNIRFRPVYFLHRMLEIKLFGANFLLLSIYTSLLVSSSVSLFYAAARKMKYSVFESLLFILLVFVGYQSAIWWRLGLNETIGMFFLGLSFYFMAKCLENKKYLLHSVLASIFLVVASLSKESFVIAVPAFVIFKIWNEHNVFRVTIWESMRKNIFLLVPSIILVVELWVILFVVGTNTIGYAGSSSGIGELAKGVWRILSDAGMLLVWLEFLFGILIIYILSLIIYGSGGRTGSKSTLKSLVPSFLLAILILLPNLYLHAKSGMTANYILPTTIGLGFFAITIFHRITNKVLYLFAFVACFLFIRSSFGAAIATASAFEMEGRITNEFLSAAANHSQPDSNVLLVVDPVTGFEFTWATKIYLAEHGIDKLYGYPAEREYGSDFEKGLKEGWEKWFAKRTIVDMDGQPDLILVINKIQSENIFERVSLSKPDYANLINEINPHAVYIKK